ncbi:polysaccharide deacetylase family protein [Hymenobacter sp. 15J16-1T3B]|uniref:polysaccharide deacetylase family protein n=1 Tax=Hymenobacter sp. 15J16-1T3B TaxID=2886941 RepID=UPI001D1256A8|nr:polysaccharide deacetylase family protein [Hymenobacter sp. 15J16-1T3B]MCC3157061.1 polysaccharide deacetylase family protein [Hymenobacter sp. 15J16-1T3B]
MTTAVAMRLLLVLLLCQPLIARAAGEVDTLRHSSSIEAYLRRRGRWATTELAAVNASLPDSAQSLMSPAAPGHWQRTDFSHDGTDDLQVRARTCLRRDVETEQLLVLLGGPSPAVEWTDDQTCYLTVEYANGTTHRITDYDQMGTYGLAMCGSTTSLWGALGRRYRRKTPSSRMLHRYLLAPLLLAAPLATHAQSSAWHGKQCAVVLTYDDALDADLDRVVPALDSLQLRGTFYLIGSSPVVAKRLDEWRKAAKKGHELGNHALMHPCDGTLPGRSFVTPDTDLSKYTVGRAVSEIRATNTLLRAIDGRSTHTFAYPCGDRTIGGQDFYQPLRNDFVAARGVTKGLPTAAQVDLSNVACYSINGQSADYMLDLVKQAQQTHTLLVFLFHGVGGGHALNVDANAHRQLLRYLKAHERDIWVAPMVEVAASVQAQQRAAVGAPR